MDPKKPCGYVDLIEIWANFRKAKKIKKVGEFGAFSLVRLCTSITVVQPIVIALAKGGSDVSQVGANIHFPFVTMLKRRGGR